jgi:hypothetical protein
MDKSVKCVSALAERILCDFALSALLYYKFISCLY